jgi:hypothetical protein
VDAQGRPVFDPTENVKALNDASVKRADDLRQAEAKRVKAELRHVHESGRQVDRRTDDLRAAAVKYQAAEIRYTQKIVDLQARHAAELRVAESARIDAIRAVDVGNVQRAAEVAGAQAEALRNQVAAAAAAAATALSAALDPIQKDIADLRRAQYEAQGQKTQVVEGRANTGAIYAAVGVAVAVVLAVLGVIGFVASRDTPTPEPVVVEVPANP